MLYKAIITLRGPTATTLRGDTIWGHLCWGIRNHDGEAKLQAFLESYANNQFPLAFSDAFPSGYLPRPVLRPSFRGTDISRHGSNAGGKTSSMESVPDYKRDKSVKYLSGNIMQSPVSPVKICQLLGTNHVYEGEVLQARPRIHNSIDRLSGTVVHGGGLYSREESFHRNAADPVLDLYVSSQLDSEQTERFLNLAFGDGYGADRSTGYGTITVGEIVPVDPFPAGNRYMALGPFILSTASLVKDLRADIFTRFGRLGDVWAHHPNPFKRPVVMYDTGATFSYENKDTAEPEVVGSIVASVHTDDRVRHLAAVPVVPITDEGYSQ
jgi:CRISPR-associated protein Csm4